MRRARGARAAVLAGQPARRSFAEESAKSLLDNVRFRDWDAFTASDSLFEQHIRREAEQLVIEVQGRAHVT